MELIIRATGRAWSAEQIVKRWPQRAAGHDPKGLASLGYRIVSKWCLMAAPLRGAMGGLASSLHGALEERRARKNHKKSACQSLLRAFTVRKKRTVWLAVALVNAARDVRSLVSRQRFDLCVSMLTSTTTALRSVTGGNIRRFRLAPTPFRPCLCGGIIGQAVWISKGRHHQALEPNTLFDCPGRYRCHGPAKDASNQVIANAPIGWAAGAAMFPRWLSMKKPVR